MLQLAAVKLILSKGPVQCDFEGCTEIKNLENLFCCRNQLLCHNYFLNSILLFMSFISFIQFRFKGENVN